MTLIGDAVPQTLEDCCFLPDWLIFLLQRFTFRVEWKCLRGGESSPGMELERRRKSGLAAEKPPPT
jgi:hypothetical protein